MIPGNERLATPIDGEPHITVVDGVRDHHRLTPAAISTRKEQDVFPAVHLRGVAFSHVERDGDITVAINGDLWFRRVFFNFMRRHLAGGE
jgi:hypothetical protein